MGRRTGLLVLAFLIAAAGTVLVFLYAHDANSRALANQQPTKVLTVRNVVPVGTTVAQAVAAGDFQVSLLPKSAVAVGALSDVSPIANDVALTMLVPGQQVVAAAFGASSAVTALPLPAGDVAVSVQLTDPTRVAGFVQPGSRVAVFLDVNPSGTTAASSSGPSPNQVRLLLGSTTVLAVGPTSSTSTTTTSSTTGQTNTQQVSDAIVTLAVNQHSAEKVIYGAEHGTLYFALVGPNSKVAPDSGVTIGNLFN